MYVCVCECECECEIGCVWRRQGEASGRVSKFPHIVEEIGATRERADNNRLCMHMKVELACRRELDLMSARAVCVCVVSGAVVMWWPARAAKICSVNER